MVTDCGEVVDRISALPRNLIDLIVERVPVHDAVRTSILSKTWRNVWGMHPSLVFDEVFFSQMLSEKGKEAQLSGVSRTISNILFLHSGPILNFHLSIPQDLPLNQCLDMDIWIKNISNNGVRKLVLLNNTTVPYKIPSYLFSCLELTHLRLTNCILNPPPIFRGCNLISVELVDVIITSSVYFGTRVEDFVLRRCTGIQHLRRQFEYNNNLSNLTIVDSTGQFDWHWLRCIQKVKTLTLLLNGTTDLISQRKKIGARARARPNKFIYLDQLVGNMPLICSLHLDSFIIQRFPPDVSNRLRLTKVNLNNLFLYPGRFYNLVQIERALSLITSFPNLRYLCIKLESRVAGTEPPAVQYLQSPSFIDRLETVKIEGVVCLKPELQFIKLLLASSPALRWMKLSKNTTIDDPKEELKILLELVQFPRVSAVAQITWT